MLLYEFHQISIFYCKFVFLKKKKKKKKNITSILKLLLNLNNSFINGGARSLPSAGLLFTIIGILIYINRNIQIKSNNNEK